MAVANRVGGGFLDGLLSFTLIVGSIGSGVTAQVGAARLLYGMGRDQVLPRKFFGYLDPKTASPSRNLWLIGAMALTGAAFLNYEECARLINFGAFLAFMGVNLAAIRVCFLQNPNKTVASFLRDFLAPAIGFIFCLLIWSNLPWKTFMLGGAWMAVGIVYLAIRTKGFRETVEMTAFTDVD
jgi:amino acid transporter